MSATMTTRTVVLRAGERRFDGSIHTLESLRTIADEWNVRPSREGRMVVEGNELVWEVERVCRDEIVGRPGRVYFGDRRDLGPRTLGDPFASRRVYWNDRRPTRLGGSAALAGALWVLRIFLGTMALLAAVALLGKLAVEIVGPLVVGMAFGSRSRGPSDTPVARSYRKVRPAREPRPVARRCRGEGCSQLIVFLPYVRPKDGRETTMAVNHSAEAERRALAGESWEPGNPELVSHHSTCPDAGNFRRQRGTGAPK